MKLTTGVDDFKELIEKEYTYVDKTLFIEDVIENSAKVQLITRPRRFGKTLNMSMLAHFFDNSQDNGHLFKGLQIQDRPCFEGLGSRPIIFVSFKKLKAENFEEFLGLFAGLMSNLYKKYKYLMDRLDEFDLEDFRSIAGKKADRSTLTNAISQLLHWLEEHHAKKAVLLIDEYDSPIDEAYNAGYYEPVITFMRGVLGEALKGNTALHKGVLTGILRISKESIFSDLNHLEVHTVVDPDFATRFGFTEEETMALLIEAGQKDKMCDVQEWYNGYVIDGNTIYNPWSVVNFLKRQCVLQPYWVNTSSNNLIHKLLLAAQPATQDTLLTLINGGTVETPLYSQTTLRDLDDAALWSLLLFSGYLTVENRKHMGDEFFYDLRIPNVEVRFLYKNVFKRFLGQRLPRPDMMTMLDGLIDGDVNRFQAFFADLIETMFSYYDTAGNAPERVYHAFVLGLLANLDYRYHIRSNRESGYGRYDLMMIPKDTSERGVIVEFKVSDTPETLDADAKAALAQIALKNYAAELEAQGVTAYSQIGIAFCGKQVKVVGKA